MRRIHAECIDEEQWLQEYCCQPADESSAFITYDMIAACADPELKLWSFQELARYAAEHPKCELFLGIDVARKHDLCVLDVGEKVGDVLWDRLRLELRGVRKEFITSGNIRFAGESPDGHCDRFWAKALRQQAARYRIEVGGGV